MISTAQSRAANNAWSSRPKEAEESPKRTKFIRFVGRSMLGVIILLGIAMIITWILINPKKPRYCVENGYIRPHVLTDRKLNGTFFFKLNSFNSNRKASIYSHFLKVTATYNDQSLEMKLPPFSLRPGNQTSLDVRIDANVVSPFGLMKKDVEGEGLPVKVHLTGQIRYHVEKWRSMDRRLQVYCPPVVLQIDSSRHFEPQCCTVDL